eukprot:840732-Amphidinium_carterae.1
MSRRQSTSWPMSMVYLWWAIPIRAEAFQPIDIGHSTRVPRQDNRTTIQRNYTLVILTTILRQDSSKTQSINNTGIKETPYQCNSTKSNTHNIGQQWDNYYGSANSELTLRLQSRNAASAELNAIVAWVLLMYKRGTPQHIAIDTLVFFLVVLQPAQSALDSIDIIVTLI